MSIKLARDSGNECGRNEHRRKAKGNRDDRSGDLVHCFVRGLTWREASGDMPFYVFDDHNRIVNNDSDREHHAKQRQHVERKAEQRPSPQMYR